MDGAEEVHRTLVISGGDGPKLLELGEEVLDQVACLVEIAVVGARRLAVALGWDHSGRAGLLQRLEHARLGIERLVGDQGVSSKTRQQGVGTLQIVRLPGREGKAGRVAERVDGRVNLRAKAAAAAPDRFVALAALLSAPALC